MAVREAVIFFLSRDERRRKEARDSRPSSGRELNGDPSGASILLRSSSPGTIIVVDSKRSGDPQRSSSSSSSSGSGLDDRERATLED